MNTAKTKKWLPSRFNTIFVKCGVATGLAVFMVVATMNLISARMTQKISHDNMSHQAIEVSTLMSLQLGGTIKFGNVEAAKQMLDSVVEAGKPAAIGGAVLNVSGDVLFMSPELESNADDVRALAMQTFETGEATVSADGLSVSAPSVFGPDSQVVGAVVTVWTDVHQNAALLLVQQDAILAAFGVAVAALGLFSVFLSRHFSIPLRNMQAAVASIEAGNYTTQIAEQSRGDEIGGIAARLVNFRDALADGAEAQRNSAFRGAAFQGSTAAMMLIDEDHNVVFANPSCTELLSKLFEEVSQVWPDVENGNFAGCDLSKFLPLTALLKKVEEDGESALPLSHIFKLGERHLSTNLNAAVDAKGKMIGAVVEWADISSAQKTSAVMETVDRKQVRLEFDKSGQCVSANETALVALASGAKSLMAQSIFDVFGAPQDDPQLTGDWQARVLCGEETSGVFNSDILATGDPRIFDGGFGAVLSPDGSTERLIFLGTDVSKARKKMREADEQRHKSQEEQKTVVDALGSALLDLSQGDLSVSIQDQFPAQYDQLRSDFNTATASLSQTVSLVSSNTEEIRKETQDITTATDEMSRRTERQAAALEEAAAALDHITTSVQSASQGAEQANDAAILAQRSAEEGGKLHARLLPQWTVSKLLRARFRKSLLLSTKLRSKQIYWP